MTKILLAESSLIERQLIALQDVPVSTTALAGPRRDNGVQTTSLELPLQRSIGLACLQAKSVLLLDALADLLLLGGLALLRLPPSA